MKNIADRVKLFFARHWLTLTSGMLLFILLMQVFTVNKSLSVYNSASKDWGLSFGASGTQPRGNASAEELAEYGAYFVGDEDEKVIYLTFDAGYENGYTAKILDVLKENQVPAAFFLVSHYFQSAPELVLRMYREGHVVGNHTATHPDMSSVTDLQGLEEELRPVEELYFSLTGEEMPKFYRPPQGKYNVGNLEAARELGYTTVFWSLAYVDWNTDKQPDPDESVEKLCSRIHNGAVVLLHSTSETNSLILDRLIKAWKAEGYTFGTLYGLTD